MSKRDVSGGGNLAQNAFGALNLPSLPASPLPAAEKNAGPEPAKPKKPGKVHARIEKSGRSGKTVTVLFGEGVERMHPAEREDLLKSLKNTLGCGGAVVEFTLELQGDVRERVSVRLRELGFTAK
jgi:translation initiation factor 1